MKTLNMANRQASEVESQYGMYGLFDMMSSMALVFLIMLAVATVLLCIRTTSEEVNHRQIKEDMVVISHLTNTIDSLQSVVRFSELREDSLRSELIRKVPKKIIIPNVVDERVFFRSGSSQIEPEFYPILDRFIVSILDDIETGKYNHIQVEGYTDIVPIRQDERRYRDNWDLGAARAIAVVRYLERHGVQASILSAASYSKYHPIGSTNSPDALEQNRRIQIMLQRR